MVNARLSRDFRLPGEVWHGGAAMDGSGCADGRSTVLPPPLVPQRNVRWAAVAGCRAIWHDESW